jgi:hypothetical protein
MIMNIGPRSAVSVAFLRGTSTTLSDISYAWTREINGKMIDFGITEWAYGDLKATIIAYKHNTTIQLHRINIAR